jgi:hypothetical protein
MRLVLVQAQGAAGVAALVGGAYLVWGAGVALLVAGSALLAGAWASR